MNITQIFFQMYPNHYVVTFFVVVDGFGNLKRLSNNR